MYLLCYALAWLFFGIDSKGVFNKLGCRRGFLLAGANVTAGAIGECDTASADSVANVVTHIGGFFCLFTAGLVAFHALRLVHRPAEAGGELALLGAGCTMVSASSARRLRRQAKWIKGVAAWLILQGIVGLLAVVLLIPDVPMWMRLLFPVWATGWSLTVWSTSAWFLSLMLGAALSATRVEEVVAAMEVAGSRRERMDDGRWRQSIEQPAVALGTEVLPLLSKGWGHSLALVGLGFVSFTAGLGVVLYEASGELLAAGAPWLRSRDTLQPCRCVWVSS
jgi:hypothetical protein